MASSTLPFRLKSYQTALAIVLPTQLHADINSLRKIHDKAYERWDPHINLLYPFVEPDQLGDAIAALKQGIEEHDLHRFDVTLDGPGKFVQKKAATIHLKPDFKSEDKAAQLRAELVRTLGRDPKEGTHDGIFRAHMTVGQAGLLGPTLERLVEKIAKLAPLSWECRSLTVLKRQPSGQMIPVDEIWLRGESEEVAGEKGQLEELDQHWKPCYDCNSPEGWQQFSENEMRGGEDSNHDRITISTYNIMADSQAPPFNSRITSIVNDILSVTEQNSYPRVLCFQEVSDEMLPLLLKNQAICEMYPYSTHQPSSLLPSDRNQVTMASFPFKHTTLPFAERHKAALVIDLIGMATKIVNVHLSAGLSDDAVSAKKRQMDVLTKFCLDHKTGEVIIAGDFNLTTSSRTIEVALSQYLISPNTAQLATDLIDMSLWDDAFLSSEVKMSDVDEENEGATFDRIGNPLAALSISPIDDKPQRYDRVLCRKGGSFMVEGTQLFGLPDEYGHCGSDHYGFSATLRIDQHKILEGVPQASTNLDVGNILVTEDTMDLNHLLQPRLPTENDREQRRRAIALVQETLSTGNGLSNLILAPLGSYLLDTYFPDSDVDLLAIGSVSSQVFFELASTRLRHLDTGTSNSVNGVHLVNSLVSIAELCILGIKFDLQYCQAPILLERYHTANSILPLHELAFDKTLVSSLPPSSLRPFNTYRDTAYIPNTIPDMSSYRTAHRFLSLYLKRHGLYSAKFGFLGGIHLSLMLNRVVKFMGAQSPSAQNPKSVFSPATIVRTFFNYYANFNWAGESVSDPNLTDESQPARTARDAVFIPAIHVPTARPNVASSCTPLSAQTFTEEFQLASKKLADGEWENCLHPNAGIQIFLAGFSAYISLSLDIWSVNEIGGTKVRGIIGALESKFPRLMLALGRLEGIYARVWPARLRDSDEDTDTSQFKGCYLIGVRMSDENADLESKKILRGKVTAAVREFENTVKASREFESGYCWLNAEFLAGKKIRDLKLVADERDWSGEQEEFAAQMDAMDEDPKLDTVSLPTLDTRPRAEDPRRPNTTPLRMPLDIINRIKHDTEHFSAAEFLIGYEDRFEEQPKEIELLRWKLEQTDEEFIPLHRVVHVRRKDESGGGVVWDRRRRLDLIFGSGKRRGD